jgi:hypothetical protein
MPISRYTGLRNSTLAIFNGIFAVTAWDTACPQFVHYAIDPENLDNLVSAVNNACATPPSYCRRNRKVSLRRLYRVTREIERQTMKKLIFVALLGTAPLAVLASQEGCGPACLANATAVFRGPTQYTMTVDNAQHAHIAVTWEPKHHTKLKPVRYEGTAPVRLRHTTVHTVEFPHDDVCNAVVTIVEAHQIDDNFDVYQVPMHNTQCN